MNLFRFEQFFSLNFVIIFQAFISEIISTGGQTVEHQRLQ